MGVLYDVLFKPIRRGDGSTAAAATATTTTTAAAAAVRADTADDPPEWVLDKRDGDSQLVWRRYCGAAATSRRRRVEFLDAVQVREFERDDDYSWCGGGDDADDGDDGDDGDDADDEQAYWTDDWCGGRDDDTKRLRFYDQSDDCPVLVAFSVTVLGMCISVAYMFAPVRWLLQQLFVDD